MGPTAQDFQAAFGLGSDEQCIGTVDADGVALAAIQGLNEKVEARMKIEEGFRLGLEEKLEQKETEIMELKKTVNELKALMNSMNDKVNGGSK
jgi:flagellar biosynthesis/type III secretory pathway protein FliH